MDDDLEYLPLSYLSQIGYCPRRAGLLLNERVWLENADTAKGRSEHERTHTHRVERRGNQIKLFDHSVFSDSLGIWGKCDLIEGEHDPSGCHIPAIDIPLRLYPVEYKHGRVRNEAEYNIQLCAQAMCLEEMYHTTIGEGAIFYISSHRRQVVTLNQALRERTLDAAQQLHKLRRELTIPTAEYTAKCKRCSLLEYCMPRVTQTAQTYCQQLAQQAKEVETV